jgi:hypothetical protein
MSAGEREPNRSSFFVDSCIIFDGSGKIRAQPRVDCTDASFQFNLTGSQPAITVAVKLVAADPTASSLMQGVVGLIRSGFSSQHSTASSDSLLLQFSKVICLRAIAISLVQRLRYRRPNSPGQQALGSGKLTHSEARAERS